MTNEYEAGGWSSAEQPDRVTACGETLAVVRKKTLLRILARREAERADLHPSDADVEAMAQHFRQHHGLLDSDELSRWLDSQALSHEGFITAMRDFTVVHMVEKQYAGDIDRLVADHIAVSTARCRPRDGD